MAVRAMSSERPEITLISLVRVLKAKVIFE